MATGGDDKGVEIVSSAVSTSSTAATQPTDKNQVNVAADTGAETDEVPQHAIGGDDEEKVSAAAAAPPPQDVPQAAAAVPQPDEPAAQGESKQQQENLPYDEENIVPSAVPMNPGDQQADDVSSLQHTNMEPKQYTRDVQEGAIAEENEDEYEEGVSTYEEEQEQQSALQRRNWLIIIMLLIFLGLVIAIGVGVGLAVKGNTSNDEEGSFEEPIGIESSNSPTEITSSTPSSFPSSEGPCIPVELGIIFDEYSDETGWLLVKGNYYPEDPALNNIVWKSKYYNPVDFDARADTFAKCFSPGYYTFVFTDKEGDGICCYHGEGAYVLSSEGKVITIGGEMDSKEESVVFELPFVEPDPVDLNGDGRDDRLGWMMPYDSTNFTEGVDCENFRLVVLTDEYGIETTWELYEGTDKSGKMIADGGPYGSEYTYVVDYCLESPKEYVLYMYDWDRRGLCCESGEGWFRVKSGDIMIIDSDGQFGEVNVTKFVLPADGSAVFTDEPTPGPFVIGKKTAYPTMTPTTKKPTPMPTAPGFVITPFPTPALP